MASAIATANSKGGGAFRFGSIWRGSRLGRTIIALNVAGLIVLVGGSLWFNETRQALIDAYSDSLQNEAQVLSQVLAVSATYGEPEPSLDPSVAAEVLLLLPLPPNQRARIFDAQGNLVADSYKVMDRVERRDLPLLRKPGGVFDPLPDLSDPKASQSDVARAKAELEEEARLAIQNGTSSGMRRTTSGERVVSVSMPLRNVAAVVGVLTIEGGEIDAIIADQRAAMIPFILIAALSAVGSSLLLNLIIARPVRRLSQAADQVRLSRAREISLPEISKRNDELGDLARSLETMTQAQSERMDAIDRFAADVAHEIRNPLTSIRSAVETLDLVKDEAPRLKLMGIVKQDLGRLDRLITDISNASRLDAELSRDAPRQIDLGKLMSDVTHVYAQSAKPDAPPVIFEPPAKPLLVAGREGPLGQVLRNLIDNAKSFTAIGGREGAAVRVSLRREGREAIITVDDDGPGIPAETLEKVFERFYTSRPRSVWAGGAAGNSGLGLAIARQIVTAHNGRISADNRIGPDGEVLGARFVVVLPAQESA